eukprot:sb/3463869/
MDALYSTATPDEIAEVCSVCQNLTPDKIMITILLKWRHPKTIELLTTFASSHTDLILKELKSFLQIADSTQGVLEVLSRANPAGMLKALKEGYCEVMKVLFEVLLTRPALCSVLVALCKQDRISSPPWISKSLGAALAEDGAWQVLLGLKEGKEVLSYSVSACPDLAQLILNTEQLVGELISLPESLSLLVALFSHPNLEHRTRARDELMSRLHEVVLVRCSKLTCLFLLAGVPAVELTKDHITAVTEIRSLPTELKHISGLSSGVHGAVCWLIANKSPPDETGDLWSWVLGSVSPSLVPVPAYTALVACAGEQFRQFPQSRFAETLVECGPEIARHCFESEDKALFLEGISLMMSLTACCDQSLVPTSVALAATESAARHKIKAKDCLPVLQLLMLSLEDQSDAAEMITWCGDHVRFIRALWKCADSAAVAVSLLVFTAHHKPSETLDLLLKLFTVKELEGVCGTSGDDAVQQISSLIAVLSRRCSKTAVTLGPLCKVLKKRDKFEVVKLAVSLLGGS